MGLETVREEIVRNAKEQESTLIAEAKDEEDRIIKKTKEKIDETKRKSDAELKERTDTIKKQEGASAELENKKLILEAKKQLIEEVFAKVKKKLEGLDSKKRAEHIKKLLERTKNDIDIGKVYCNKKDLKLLKDFKAEAADMIGGLIADTKDERIRVDYSFDRMLQTIKENELQTINKLLFSPEKAKND